MGSFRKILAIETSGRIGSVAIANGPELLAEHTFSEGMRHAVELMPTIRALFNHAGWTPADLSEIYVSTGPGSFTGLRIAISIARALNQAVNCKLLAVPTLDVLSLNAPPDVANLLVVLDAKRGQVFGAHYVRKVDPNSPIDHVLPSIGGEEPLARAFGPALITPADLIARARAQAHPIHVLGEGVDYHRASLASPGVVELDRALWPARASNVHRIGYQRAQAGLFSTREGLLPTYIRLAEAEEVYRKKHNLPL